MEHDFCSCGHFLGVWGLGFLRLISAIVRLCFCGDSTWSQVYCLAVDPVPTRLKKWELTTIIF